MESNGFRIRLKDYLAWILHYRFVKPTYTRLAMHVTITLCLILAGLSFVSRLPRGVDVAATQAILVLLGFSAWMLVLNFALPAFGYWQLRMNGNYRADCRIAIDEEHVHTWDGGSDLRKAWSAIDQVTETRSHILIYFNRCNAFVVPKAAFNSTDDANAFRRAAETFLNGARAKA